MSTQTLPEWTVSDRLVKAREWAHMTQDDIAKALDMSRRTVVRHEHAEHPPRWFVLAYAEATSVPAEWIYGEMDTSLISRCFPMLDPPGPGQLEFHLAA